MSTSEQSSNPGRNPCITHAGYNAAVTGAGSGNGKVIAETLLAEGARVALLDIDPESLKDSTSRFAGAFAVPVDVTDADSVHDAIGAIEQEFGHLDILVNNAGIVRSSNFADLPLHEWNEVFAVNSTGPFLMSQAAMPLLRKGAAARGPQGTSAIVNITSVEAHIVISSSGHPQVHYNASKGALLQLTRALAVECAPDRVRVNAVAPGFIETPFTRSVLGNPDVKNWLLERTPMGRIESPKISPTQWRSSEAKRPAGSPAQPFSSTAAGRSIDMQRPLIAVSADIDELPTAFGNMDCTKLNAEYTNAIYAAGGQPMILPVVAEPPTELLTQMDGLLLTGHPAEPQGTPEKISP